ncbi:MAG: sulfide/dihydroorotate dehydrogenase-like FAD/NAD-binding protein [Oscillospiraceae bacterium]
MFKIVEKRYLNQSVVSMKIEAPFVAKKAQAGQFIMFRVDEHGERVPLTIADYDREAGTVSIMFQLIGKSTKALGEKNAGDYILDFVGPLGNLCDFEGVKKAIVVGGGVGCAVAYPQAKHLFTTGVHVVMIAGFRNKDIVILEDEMREMSNEFYISTDDGSYAEKGFVTDRLKKVLDADPDYDLVIAFGPVPMMSAVCDLTKGYGVKTMVSLTPIMIDGTGMCGGCRVTVDGEVKFACVDGPDFDGHKVDFKELMQRNSIYKEREIHDKEHPCRLGGLVND